MHEKKTGELKESLGRLVFFSQNKRNPFTIAVTTSNYDSTSIQEYNSLSIYKIDEDKKYFFLLRNGKIKKAMEAIERNHPEYLFEEPVVHGETIILRYFLTTPKNNSDRRLKTIKVDLRKYSR